MLAVAHLWQSGEPSLAKVVSVFLFMLAGCAALLVTALDAREEHENDGPLREAAPEVYDGKD